MKKAKSRSGGIRILSGKIWPALKEILGPRCGETYSQVRDKLASLLQASSEPGPTDTEFLGYVCLLGYGYGTQALQAWLCLVPWIYIPQAPRDFLETSLPPSRHS